MLSQNANQAYPRMPLLCPAGVRRTIIVKIVRYAGLMIALALIVSASVLPQPVTAQTGEIPLQLQWSSTEFDITRSVAWGDYDGDGDLDLAVGNGDPASPYYAQPNRLYRNDGGALTANAVWSSAEADYTTSIAWGDYDGDGDLDLAVGNRNQPNRLYRNDGGELTTSTVWSSDGTDDTTSVAWGDYDSDGDLDLAVGNRDQPNRLYRNDGGGLTTSAVWSSVEEDYTYSLAWGDYDGDGDPDLAVGNGTLSMDQSNRLYRNDGGALTTSAVWSSGEEDRTYSLAWGDYDGDGDLDLAVGNRSEDQPNRLYRNNSGVLTTSAVWSSGEADYTTSIAWGDYDGDGDLDLAVGNKDQSNRLHLNDEGSLTVNAVWSSDESDDTRSVAWGDCDGDGDLDLAAGNLYQPNRLYGNDSGQLTVSAAWSPVEIDHTQSVAWGDYDGDGDLDLVVGNGTLSLGQSNQLYRNDSGVLTASAVWASVEEDLTYSLAWGDYDSDGDLDLAVGNRGQSNRLYRNDDGELTTSAVWSSVEEDDTEGVTWGDYDGDGDLDLAVGNYDQPNQLYRNHDGMLTTSAIWLSVEADATNGVAWGDYDGDDDLDLAVGNGSGQASRLYRNDGGVLTTGAAWSSVEDDHTESVAWGDYDGDGDLDLAAGNWDQPCRLYRNDGGALTASAAWSSVETDDTRSAAWGDYDGDGDLDLVVGNYDQPNRLYRNDDGELTINAAWSSNEAAKTESVAWGDYDGDGDLDLAVGNFKQYNQLYHNLRRSGAPLVNDPPYATIPRPGPTDDADLFSTPHIITESNFPIPYRLLDREGDAAHTIFAGYSLNGGGQWWPAVAANGTVTTNLNSGAVHTYTWDVFQSGLMGQSDNVVFRLIVAPVITSTPNQIPGPYLYGSTTATSFPFRVKGTQVRVLSDTVPISNALVYHLPRDQLTGGSPFADDSGTPFRTDEQGYLQGRGQIAIGDRLLALAPVHTALGYAGALEFDGVDDYVIKKPLRNAPITATTVSFWMRSEDTTGSGTPLSYASPITDNTFLVTDYNNFTIHRGNSVSVTTGITATDGTWHHIAVTWCSDGGDVKLYKDGVAAYTGTLAASTVISPGGSLVLGKDQNGTGFFEGDLDQVRIWNIVRTEAQIQADMFRSLKGDEAGMVVYWPFDDPSDSTAFDQTTNGNDGTLVGATWVGDSLGGYTVYHTSGEPTESGLDAFTVTEPGVQVLTVTAEHPLILFDIGVSLEWDVHNDLIYLQQLEFDLQEASEYLYDFTNGQVALGQVTVHQNADDWAYSHVAVHATNRLRPFAAQGGIVLTATIDPQHDDIVYDTGQVHMGATWNRYGTPGQNLGLDWPLILAHELSHFLLYLDDVYLGLNDDGLLIPVDTCTGSAMGDVYVPDNTEFIYDENHWNTKCADTLPARTLERNEWETIRLWYPWLTTPVITNTGPIRMPFDLTTVTVLDPITPTDVLEDPTFYLDYTGSDVSSSEARAFLLRNGDDDPDDFEYIYDLGSPVGGQNRVLARGAQPGDRLCVFDRPRSQYGCEVIVSGDERLWLEKDETWTPVVQLSPVNSTTFGIQVGGLISDDLSLKARLYPEFGSGFTETVLSCVNGVYSGTLDLAYPAMIGHVQIWVDEATTETNPRREATVAYAIGGNPGTHRGGGGTHRGGGGTHRGGGGTHRGGGGTHRGGGAPLVSPDGQMIFFTENPIVFREGEFYTVQNMAGLPPLPEGKTAIGQGYNLVSSPNITQVITGSISFQYLESDVLVEKVDEAELTIHSWDGSGWRALDTVCETYYNLASASSQGSGVYAILAGVTTPGITNVSPSIATNDVTNTLVISGGYFLPPVAVALVGPTATYTLPLQLITPYSITAVVTQGLQAREYQVVVFNLNEPGGAVASPTPGIFALYDPSTPADACFYDYFESGIGKWKPGGEWDIVILPTGERALTDSPMGPYKSAGDYDSEAITYTTYVTSQAFSLTGCTDPVLTFRHDYVIANGEAHQDAGRVEISTDNGATWTELTAYSGGGIFGFQAMQMEAKNTESSEWADVHWKDAVVDLSGYADTVRLRFGLKVDRYVSDKGWVMKDVIVQSGSYLTTNLQIRIGRDSSGDVVAGEPITYTLAITNAGPDTVDAVITDTFPSSAIASVGGSAICSGNGPIICSLDDFSGTQNLTLVLTTSASFSGTLTNGAIVTPTTPSDAETAPEDNEDSVATIVRRSVADLQIHKTRVGSGEVIAGESVSYTLTITNSGLDTVNAVVTDTFTADAVASVSGSAGCSGDGDGPVVCHINNFTGTRTISVVLTTGAFSGTLTNTAVITAVGLIDPNPDNNWSQEVTCSVRFPVADLQIHKARVDSGEVIAGEPITYTLVITNAGPDTVNAVVTDTFTAGAVASVSGSAGCSGDGDGPVVCHINNFTGTRTISVVLTTGAFSGTLTNTAAVTAVGLIDPNPDNNWSQEVTCSVRFPVADLQIHKARVGSGGVVAGEPITYTLTVTNVGSDIVHAVVTDTFTAGAVASVSSSAGCSGDGDGPVVCHINNFTGTRTISVVLTTGAFSGTLTNTAVITAVGLIDPNPDNNWSQGVTCSVRFPATDLQIHKARVDSGGVVAGEPITYTLVITNAGPDTVNAVVTDTFTAGAVASVSSSAGCSGDGDGPVVCHINNFTGTRTISVVLTTGAYSGTLTNTAVITAVGLIDPNPDNNWSSDSVNVVVRPRTRIFLPLILKEE